MLIAVPLALFSSAVSLLLYRQSPVLEGKKNVFLHNDVILRKLRCCGCMMS